MKTLGAPTPAPLRRWEPGQPILPAPALFGAAKGGRLAKPAEKIAKAAGATVLKDAPEGELRLAMTVGFARQLAPALAPLLAAQPGLRLHLQVEDGFTDLVAHRIDRANVIDKAVGEIDPFRQPFAIFQHVGDTLVGSVAAGKDLA